MRLQRNSIVPGSRERKEESFGKAVWKNKPIKNANNPLTQQFHSSTFTVPELLMHVHMDLCSLQQKAAKNLLEFNRGLIQSETGHAVESTQPWKFKTRSVCAYQKKTLKYCYVNNVMNRVNNLVPTVLKKKEYIYILKDINK